MLNSRICLVNDSAQTEQIAAILRRRSSIPCVARRSCASFMIRADRFAQSERYAHSSPSDAMNTPSKPCSSANRTQPGLTALVQGRLTTTTSGE